MKCAQCVDHLTHRQTGLLADSDGAAIDEHLEQCVDCRRFNGQLVETDSLLELLPRPTPRTGKVAVPSDAEAEAVLVALQQVADSLDRSRADDLVQDVLAEALASGDKLDLNALTQSLIDRVLADGSPVSRGIDDFSTADRSQQLDPDADTSKLFYPEFYVEGPDLGGFVDAPNQWGGDVRLTPEADLITGDLVQEVDDALAALKLPIGQIARLVLIDGMSIGSAAAAFRISPHEAAYALHTARVHLRGVVANSL